MTQRLLAQPSEGTAGLRPAGSAPAEKAADDREEEPEDD